MPFLVPGDIDVDFQTRPSEGPNAYLPYGFGANPFSGSRDISYTNKKVTNSAQNRTLRSSLRAVKTHLFGELHEHLLAPMRRLRDFGAVI